MYGRNTDSLRWYQVARLLPWYYTRRDVGEYLMCKIFDIISEDMSYLNSKHGSFDQVMQKEVVFHLDSFSNR